MLRYECSDLPQLYSYWPAPIETTCCSEGMYTLGRLFRVRLHVEISMAIIQVRVSFSNSGGRWQMCVFQCFDGPESPPTWPGVADIMDPACHAFRCNSFTVCKQLTLLDAYAEPPDRPAQSLWLDALWVMTAMTIEFCVNHGPLEVARWRELSRRIGGCNLVRRENLPGLLRNMPWVQHESCISLFSYS